uniref:Protein tweety homolog n=1 Tax=Rhabditophanes sp. KR3021 TaxID=114890 RepID=A0AC35U4V9_9BILA
MEIANTVAKYLHNIPHYNFALKRVESTFDPKYSGDYLQSLFFYAGSVIVLAFFLLLIITTVWICACVGKRSESGRNSKRAMRLALGLFLISLTGFILIGVCYAGNEYVNRGVKQSSNGLLNVYKELKQAIHQEINQMDILLTTLTNGIENVSELSTSLKKILDNIKFFESAKLFGDTVEFERWIMCIVLFSIMLFVLFLGIVSFCRKSKKGAVAFSGIGLVIFLLSFSILAIILPATIAFSDFCMDGNKYIKGHVTDDLISAVEFYSKCDAKSGKNTFPEIFELPKLSNQITNLRDSSYQLFNVLNNVFPQDMDLEDRGKYINEDFSSFLQSAGALERALSCHTFSDDVHAMKTGFCQNAFLGSTIILAGLIFLSFDLWILLLVICKSWNIFSRGPSSPSNIGDDDPFFPNGNDSAIPVDIYGTHVFNPRSRFANSMDHDEPSTGTTTATGNIPANINASTPLLDNDRTGIHWQRNLTTTSSLLATAPPGTTLRDTNSHVRVTYSNHEDDFGQYPKYQEQFDV